MTTSIFIEYVQKWFNPLVKQIAELVNGSKEAPNYLYDVYLVKEESADLKWGSLSSDGTVVMASVVSMDSELPLVKRDSISKATGDIPKLGMKLYLNERQLNELDMLSKKDGKEQALIQKLFADSKKAYVGVKERLEYMFLQALSSGVTLIAEAENTGLGIRIDFGVPAGNKNTVVTVWSDVASTPIDDIETTIALAKGKGDSLKYIFMDKTAFNNFRKTTQVKESYASFVGFAGSTIPVPNLSKANEMLNGDYGLTAIIIDRTCKFEKDGSQTVVTPWTDGAVTLTTSLQLGTLTHGDVAEVSHKVDGVEYETVDGYVLLSKYRKNDPVREFTSSQAMAVPVLNNIASLYMIDTKTAT